MPVTFFNPPSRRQGSQRFMKHVHISMPEPEPKSHPLRHRTRITSFQHRWKNIREDLPPQFSRRHIGMISIGGVIGTGLFLGSADALCNGGPLGALLAYSAIGTVVYCLCISIGEMISFLPNVGGVVGLADLYVDPALGFALGWMSWYNWTMTFPAEVTATAVVVKFWDAGHTVPVLGLLGLFLVGAIVMNCLPPRFYGEVEFWLLTMKVITVVFILVLSLALDLGAGAQGFIGFKNWSRPFSDSYLGIQGRKGQFLGFWTVMMQAFFSFSGSEIAGIAAGEVIDATRVRGKLLDSNNNPLLKRFWLQNVPRALKNVWIRITFFYLGSIFFAGLLVPQSTKGLRLDGGTAASSPFVIALQLAHVKIVPHIINVAVLLAAWSAAAADLYISSRFLFFVARCGHAPECLATLIKYPWYRQIDAEEFGDTGALQAMELRNLETIRIRRTSVSHENASSVEEEQKPYYYVLPWACVLVSSSFGFLSFLSHRKGSSAQIVFRELCVATSAGSLLTWTAILYTYLRWYQGSVHAERKCKLNAQTCPRAKRVMQCIEKIKKQRHPGQPYCAIYGFSMCILIILTNGWSVFVSYEWHIAKAVPAPHGSVSQPGPITRFLASYIPIPCFLFLALAYKLVYRTKMITLDEMCFAPEGVPDVAEYEEPLRRGWRKIIGWVLLY